MTNRDIVGGVSPLKARASKGKAGKVGIKATNVKAQRKSGFTESGKNVYNPTGAHNLESLTGNTRVGSSLVDSLKLKDPGTGTGTGSAISGKKDFGKVGEFGETEFKTETTSKTVKTDKDGNVVKIEDQACSKEYIAIHGDADCIAYNKYRDANPVNRSDRASKTVDTKEGFYRTRKDKNAEWGKWLPTKGTKYEKK